jgi:glycosyltransferase involved in cell wall biosynthesis
VRHALRGREFDVVVIKTAHDWWTLLRDIAVVFLVRRQCRPVVLQLHGSQSSRLVEPGSHAFKLVTAGLLALVDGIMVLSTQEQHEWEAFRRHPPVFTVKNPYVREPALSPDLGRTLVAERPQLLFVGRLIEEKGIFDLVDALRLVLQQEKCHLIVVGEGELEPKLNERIRHLGLEEHVRRTGYLSGADLHHEYHSASIFVLPTSWAEGFPTVIAEAMDAGLAIVTTRIRGAADYLVEGENALFVEPGEVKSLAAAMTTLLGDPDLRARMASANRQRIGIFAPDVVAAEYLQVLHAIIGAAAGLAVTR